MCTRWWRSSLGGRGAHENGVLTRRPLRYLVGARRGSTPGLGCGAHDGVYEVVALLSGREGSSQGQELEAGAPPAAR